MGIRINLMPILVYKKQPYHKNIYSRYSSKEYCKSSKNGA